MNSSTTIADLKTRIALFQSRTGEFERNTTRQVLYKLWRLQIVVFGSEFALNPENLRQQFKAANIKFDADLTKLGDAMDFIESLPPETIEQLPLYKELFDLHGYASFGLEESSAIFDYDFRTLASAMGVEFAEELQPQWFPDSEYQSMIEAARCRMVIDGEETHKDQTVSVQGLALLVNLNVKTLRNILAREGSGIQLIKSGPHKGTIEAHLAREWVKTRPEYLPTIPKSVHTAVQEGDLQLAQVENGPFYFVPVSAEGVTFNLSSTVNGKYEIVSEGKTIAFENFFDALAELQTQANPAWRRKIGANRVRSTTPTHWIRVPQSTLKEGETI
jgi:hypothetical protein